MPGRWRKPGVTGSALIKYLPCAQLSPVCFAHTNCLPSICTCWGRWGWVHMQTPVQRCPLLLVAQHLRASGAAQGGVRALEFTQQRASPASPPPSAGAWSFWLLTCGLGLGPEFLFLPRLFCSVQYCLCFLSWFFLFLHVLDATSSLKPASSTGELPEVGRELPGSSCVPSLVLWLELGIQ